MMETITTLPELTEFERRLLRLLDVDGRAPFSRLAANLGVSQHTVARAYRRLFARGVRLVGEFDFRRVDITSWTLRIGCTPDGAQAIAAALARREDTTWVSLMSGGTEITCRQRARGQHPDSLLLEQLPRTNRVTSVSAQYVLHEFTAGQGSLSRWLSISDDTDANDLELTPVPARLDDAEPVALDDVDEAIITVLRRDGRASHTELARVANTSESTVRRRLEHLLDSGAVYIGVEIDQATLGLNASAMLWLSVDPGELTEVGTTLAAHLEFPFVAAVTGPSNLIATVVSRNPRELYQQLTERIGALPAIHHVETAPRMRTLKREGDVRSGGRDSTD
jgi:DNA-binding Lrp family transcriptional regulator